MVSLRTENSTLETEPSAGIDHRAGFPRRKLNVLKASVGVQSASVSKSENLAENVWPADLPVISLTGVSSQLSNSERH